MMQVLLSMSKGQRVMFTTAFIAGFALAWYLRGEVEQEVTYREKANFCIDRMENAAIRYVWRQKYCGNVKLDAVDPITGKPVTGIVEGE